MDYIHVANSHGKRSTRNDVLKLIAMVTMFIDHVGLLFFPEIRLLRTIGRIAFPIFAYQIAIGYDKTHDRLAYAKRLFIFALLSQFPYVFLDVNLTVHIWHLNVICLFFYSLIVLFIHDLTFELWERVLNRFKWTVCMQWFCMIILLWCLIFLPKILEIMFVQFMFSYSTYGLLMILLFHRFRHQYVKLALGYVALSIGFAYLNGGTYFVRHVTEPWPRLVGYIQVLSSKSSAIGWNIMTWKNGLLHLDGYFFQSRSGIALFIIAVAEHMRPRFHMHKYIAYAFYPAHITFLLVIRWLI